MSDGAWCLLYSSVGIFLFLIGIWNLGKVLIVYHAWYLMKRVYSPSVSKLFTYFCLAALGFVLIIMGLSYVF